MWGWALVRALWWNTPGKELGESPRTDLSLEEGCYWLVDLFGVVRRPNSELAMGSVWGHYYRGPYGLGDVREKE
jgi:hypothetical protein